MFSGGWGGGFMRHLEAHYIVPQTMALIVLHSESPLLSSCVIGLATVYLEWLSLVISNDVVKRSLDTH